MTDTPPVVIWGTRRKIDPNRRITFGREILAAAGLDKGDTTQVYVLDGEIRIRKANA